MSCVALAIADDAIVLAADGAFYDEHDGAVQGFASKVLPLPERNAVIAWTGLGLFGQALYWEIGQRLLSFDKLVAMLPEAARLAHLKLCVGAGRHNLHPDNNKVSVLLAGYSDERERFEAYRVVSYAKDTFYTNGELAGRLEPWVMNPIEWVWASHAPPAEVCEEFGLTEPPADLVELCARYVCANRPLSGTVRDEDGNIEGVYGVGGFLQMVIVKRDHVQSWIAHRWPDEIGKPVDPTVGEPMPAFPLKLPN